MNRTAYFSTLTQDSNFPTKERLTKYIRKNPLSFTYGKVTYLDYQGKYESAGSGYRKKIAIPMAIWSGVVKSIYHLASAIFYSLTMVFSKANQNNASVALYSFARDLEEGTGWLVTLFKDKLGSYLVEGSRFQKECYHLKTSPKVICHSSTTIGGVVIPDSHKARQITLKDFLEMGDEKRAKNIQKFRLQEDINAYGGEDFYAKLNRANPQVLDLIDLVEFKTERSKVGYALLSDEEFGRLTVEDLDKVERSPSNRELIFISKRLNLQNLADSFVIVGDVLKMPLIHFCWILGERINQIIDQIPPSAFFLLNTMQLKDLDLSKISAEQLTFLFHQGHDKERKERFASLSLKQVQSILDRLKSNQLDLISDEQLRGIDLAVLSEEKIQKLFEYRYGEVDKKRFACLSAVQVQSILSKLGKYPVSLITPDQLKGLDLSFLSTEQVKALFPRWSIQVITEKYKEHIYTHTKDLNGVEEYFGLPEKQVAEESEKIKKSNEAKLACLSQIQMDQIFEKLSEENQELAKSLS